MSFTVTANKDLKGDGVRLVSPQVFDEISALGGYGVRATGFNASTAGLAVNKETQNFADIMKLLGGKVETNEKEGK